MGTSYGVIVSKLDSQSFTSELESHLVPHSYAHVPHLSKKLCKYIHTYIHTYAYMIDRFVSIILLLSFITKLYTFKTKKPNYEFIEH